MSFARGFGSIVAGGWRASRVRMTIVVTLILLNYVSWPLAPLALKHVTDAVVRHDAHAAAVAAAFLPLIALLAQVGSHLSHGVLVELADTTVIGASSELGDLAHGPRGLEHHERPDYADEIELIRNEGSWQYLSLRSALSAVGVALQVVFTVALLALLQPILLLLFVFAVPPLAATRWSWRRYEATWRANTDRLRSATHLVDLALRPDAAKEIRVFGLEEELARRLRTTRTQLRRERFRAEYQGVLMMSAGNLVFALAYVAALFVVVRGAVDGKQTAGDVVLAVSLAAQTNRLVFDVVAVTQHLQRSTQAVARLGWLRDLVRRLYPARVHDVPAPERLDRGIRFERVSFRYPGTAVDVLEDVDLDLAAGTTIALVGENGAGKSTLVKLLCRFYEPTAGRIAVDGRDLGRIDPAAWRGRIAAGFQDFVRFELLARETVGVGNLAAVDDGEAVADAVGRAAATDVVSRLARGLETPLGLSQSDGTELSGGQWQKLALARAMMRRRPLLLLLDEPTSALDAHAEHELFDRYAASARDVARATGGIAVFVSHRFSTVRMADRIVVIDEGRVAEHGTHEELIERRGIYADLFTLQAAAYG